MTPEFQAVVLAAGTGSRFTDLTAHKPKCLLPLGNLPMVWYPLNLLQRIGFQEVIVVVHEHAKAEVAAIPKRFGLEGLKLDLVCISEEDDHLGTADAIRLVSDRIVSQRVMVLSCDLVTDLPIHNLADLHRVHGAAVTALFARAGLDHKTIPVPGPKSKPKKERDLVGLDANTGLLCYLASAADIEDTVTVRRSLLQEHPHINIQTNLVDAHFYIFEKWVVDFVASNKTMRSIKGELLPYLVKKQFSRRARKKGDAAEETTPNPKLAVNDDELNENKDEIYSFIPKDPMVDQAQRLSFWNDHTGDLKDAYYNRPLRCYAFVQETGSCFRANTLYSFCEINRQIGRLMPAVAPAREVVNVHPGAQIEPRAQVGPECLIGEGTYVSNKTTLKNSILGSNCRVEEKVRLTNCIVQDSVTVGEGCQVTGSILCDGAVIPEKAEIKDCIVGKGCKFSKEGKHSNEVLMEESDRMMEI